MKRKPSRPLPEISPGEFLVLGALLAGPRDWGSLREAIDWRGTSLEYVVRKLHDSGFVRRARVTVYASARRTDERRRLLAITPAGKAAWLEFADWTAFTAQRFSAQGAGEGPEIVAADSIPRQRPPNRNERRRLLRAAHPALNRLCRLAWGLPGVSIAELAALDVGDFDRGEGMLRVGGERWITVEGDAAQVLAEAAGERDAGPLILNGRGRRWTAKAANQSFRKLRARLKLSRAVQLRGQNRRVIRPAYRSQKGA